MGYIVEQYHDNRAGLVFAGNRNAIWHRLGEQAVEGDTAETLATKARMDYTVSKARAFATLSDGSQVETDRYFVVREDIQAVLSPGVVSSQYRLDNLQPVEVIRHAMRYTDVDKRWQFSAAGMLDNGARIWATSSFNSDLSIAGERHLAYLLLSTTYDASACSTEKLCVVRAICDNTLAAALGDGTTEIKVRHNTVFDPVKVAKNLAKMAQAVERFKLVGDAMAAFEVTVNQASRFFRECLDIPFDAKIEDVSKRKVNQFYALNDAYKTSVAEGAPKLSSWALLQGLTRYVDHDRSTRNSEGDESAKRFQSAQWGSGEALKSRGMAILQGILKDAGKLPALVD
jgi:phage/plasmid-like protein (TIGR03299 family)